MLSNFLLLGQVGSGGGFAALMGVIALFVAIVFLGMILLVIQQYKSAPSHRVLVIYGDRRGRSAAAKTIHGGSAFVIPLIQDYAFLSLEPIQIEVPLRGALSAENIRVNVPSVFTVA